MEGHIKKVKGGHVIAQVLWKPGMNSDEKPKISLPLKFTEKSGLFLLYVGKGEMPLIKQKKSIS